jgi:dCTP diphosphatase
MTDLEGLRTQLRAFAAARDWEPFHSPKNLAMALSGEAAELLEVFQWLTEEQSHRLDAQARSAAADEVADVLLYLVRIADKLDLDLLAEAQRKLADNERRYPVDKARGSAKKYTEL